LREPQLSASCHQPFRRVRKLIGEITLEAAAAVAIARRLVPAHTMLETVLGTASLVTVAETLALAKTASQS
jgi:hypothetical protein